MKALISVFLTIFIIDIKACDICGCSVGSLYLGIMPKFRTHYIGLHYQHQVFKTLHHESLGTEKTSTELLQSFELRGRYNINNRIQILGFVPVHYNQQIEETNRTSFKGLGDLSALINYHLINSENKTCTEWKQNLQIGAGLKLPTGKSKQLDVNNIWNPYLQAGTGSWDVLMDVIYTLRYKKYGLNNTILYTLNSVNQNQYQFGNRMSVNSSFFMIEEYKYIIWAPNFGLQTSLTGSDVHDGYRVVNSGGDNLSLAVGSDFYYKNIYLGMNVALPLYNNNDLISPQFKINTTLLYNF